MPNRLANETSPYLLQHAHNPVDWYPWGPEALERAKREDKPIFLSIGYAACHWCHVMERESFEDAATAEDLNRDFVAVKVDREERPDLDQVYMAAVQAMTGGGGWPMSVFLTPDGQPFYGGTYFPPQPTHGLPAFRQVLAGVAGAWRDDRLEVVGSAARMVAALASQAQSPGAGPAPTRELLDAATAEIERQFDARNGGWGSAPKFPQPMTIEYLLRRAATTGDPRPLAVARRTLDAMADGGIHDQLGGGFHRYATDAIWLVPHFEQMLYDNAQLARAYVHAWEATGDERYREVAVGTLDYVLRELRRDDGTFAASQDADTNGEEGATFVWSAAEVREVLDDDAPAFSAEYDVTDDGNWEGRTILRRVTPPGEPGLRIHASRVPARGCSPVVRRVRSRPETTRRWPPGTGSRSRRSPTPVGRSTSHATGTRRLRRPTGSSPGCAGPTAGSVDRGRTTGRAAKASSRTTPISPMGCSRSTRRRSTSAGSSPPASSPTRSSHHFTDPAGGFFDTADDHEALVTRPKDVQDNATPAGSSMAATVLLRLAALTGESRYRAAADAAIATVSPYLARYPTGFANWLAAAHLAVEGIDELAVVGDPADEPTQDLIVAGLEAARRAGRNLVVAVSADPDASAVPLLAGRTMIDGRPTAYLCRNFACRLPVTDPAALAAEVERSASMPFLA